MVTVLIIGEYHWGGGGNLCRVSYILYLSSDFHLLTKRITMVTTTDTPMMYILCSVPSHLKDSTRPSVVQDTQKQKSAFNSESLNAVASIWKFETCVFAIELCFQFKVFLFVSYVNMHHTRFVVKNEEEDYHHRQQTKQKVYSKTFYNKH